MVYDAQGNAHSLQITLHNPVANPPAGAGVPAGATQKWTLTVSLDGTAVSPAPTLYEAGGKFIFTNGNNPGNSIGFRLLLNGIGTGGAPTFPLQVDFGGLSDQSKAGERLICS